MSTRIQWADIVKAARETSEELVGKDWVNAGIKARVLLDDLADERERLRALCRSTVNHLESLSDRAVDGGLPYLGVSLQELANRLDAALDADAKSLSEAP